MTSILLWTALLILQTGTPVPSTPYAQIQSPAPASKLAAVPELLKVNRIFVDSFGDDAISREMQSMVVSALVASKRFKVTENREKAAAILKGVALEKTSQELHAYGEGTAVGGASGGYSGHLSGSAVNGTGSVSGNSRGGFIARHMATEDSSVNTETIDHARVSVRLVNADGDVIWTTSQERKGAKYKGASADAADMCIKQLLNDIERAQPSTSDSHTPPLAQ
jgi:curli biogenesis system outer membrane secretion channel CsgG